MTIVAGTGTVVNDVSGDTGGATSAGSTISKLFMNLENSLTPF